MGKRFLFFSFPNYSRDSSSGSHPSFSIHILHSPAQKIYPTLSNLLLPSFNAVSR